MKILQISEFSPQCCIIATCKPCPCSPSFHTDFVSSFFSGRIKEVLALVVAAGCCISVRVVFCTLGGLQVRNSCSVEPIDVPILLRKSCSSWQPWWVLPLLHSSSFLLGARCSTVASSMLVYATGRRQIHKLSQRLRIRCSTTYYILYDVQCYIQ